MKYFVILLQIILVYGVPIKPGQPHLQNIMPLQESQIEQQLLALQELQNLRRLAAINPVLNLNTQRPATPIILVIMNSPQSVNDNEKHDVVNQESNETNHSSETEKEDEDLDSITVEAKPKDTHRLRPFKTPPRAIILVPNNRMFSLGSIISAIPFLPIEINVPDTISWIYNGISEIIAGIGNRFKPMPPQTENMKLFMKHLHPKYKEDLPIFVVPMPPMIQMPIGY